MVKNNECKVEITTRNKKYYNDRNYNCEVGDVISIDVSTMAKKSHNIVTVICEICKKKVKNFEINKNDAASVIVGKIVLQEDQAILARSGANSQVKILLSLLETSLQ